MTLEKRMSVRIDAELHKQFKLYCVRNNTDMSTVITDYIKEIVGRNNDMDKTVNPDK